VSREVLAAVINTFDAYVQYSVCEGFGMPMVEAAACQIPVFAVDYSAMSDVVRKVKGFPVRVERFFRDRDTGARRALPDNGDLVEGLVKFFSSPRELRARWGYEAR